MRSPTSLRQFLVLAGCLFAPTMALHAQAGGAAPGAAAGTPPTPPEGMAAFPVPPAGYNEERAGIPHGELTLVEYD